MARKLAMTLAAAAALAVPAQAATPYFPWPNLLPGVPTRTNPQPKPVPGCAKYTLKCSQDNVAKLARIEQQLGCDHRAVFAATYRFTTQTVIADMKRHRPRFADPKWILAIDALFHDYYYDALAGKSVPQAWRIAFGVASSGDANATKDMLLGVNAHVQRDLPYVLATVGLHTPSGASRKRDWDNFQIVLNDAYNPIVDFVSGHYDPSLRVTNPGTVIDGAAGQALFQVWREKAFRNAERLLNARTAAARRSVERSIETTATATAKLIEAVPDPFGYRPVRDAYCATHNP
jgi:hypothetical protein